MDTGDRINALGVAVNVGLAVAKLGIGTLTGSAALFADGLNSTGDVFATAIAWIGYRVARRPPDSNHPSGHGSVESLAGLVIGVMLLATGAYIAIDGVRALVRGLAEPPELLALWVALGVAIVKEGLYRVTHRVGERLNAPSLLASARDHRADVFVAFTVAGGIAAAQTGLAWLDPLAAILVGLWVAGMSWDPIRTNLGALLVEQDEALAAEARALLAAVPGVVAVQDVRFHTLGATHQVLAEVNVDPTLSLRDATAIADAGAARIHESIEHVREARVFARPAD